MEDHGPAELLLDRKVDFPSPTSGTRPRALGQPPHAIHVTEQAVFSSEGEVLEMGLLMNQPF